MKKPLISFMTSRDVLPYTAIILLAACTSSPETKYYTLSPTVTPMPHSPVKVIEVLPVGLPDRLDRSQIVLQDQNGQTQVLDEQRWAANLSAELQNGLSAGLQQQLGAVDRYSSGVASGQAAYRIAANFSRFDLMNQARGLSYAAQQVDVSVAWIVKRVDPNPTPVGGSKAALAPDRQISCRMAFSTPVTQQHKPILDAVAAARQSLTDVVNAIAVSVSSLEQGVAVNGNGVTCS